jgi:hypothetical protein
MRKMGKFHTVMLIKNYSLIKGICTKPIYAQFVFANAHDARG